MTLVRGECICLQAAGKLKPEPPRWDARTGRALAIFANLLREGRVAELTAASAQELTLEEVIVLHQVSRCSSRLLRLRSILLCAVICINSL